MSQEILSLLYISVGLVGAWAHWFKKRYGDKTTNTTLSQYIFLDFRSTLIMLGGLMFSETVLASVHPDTAVTLAEWIGALTAGYVADSSLNKAGDKL